jgi:hypothetical protein
MESGERPFNQTEAVDPAGDVVTELGPETRGARFARKAHRCASTSMLASRSASSPS